MLELRVLALRRNRYFLAIVLGAILILTGLPARAWEVGVINTWIHNDHVGQGGGTAHGFNLFVQQEVWKYADVGLRAGYMRSDCFKTYYVPLEVTGALKYPLAEGRFVPFAGIIGGYHIYTQSKLGLDNSLAATPMAGFDWRFGKQKKWAFHVEGLYQFSQADIKGGGHSRFDGPGGAGGISFRF